MGIIDKAKGGGWRLPGSAVEPGADDVETRRRLRNTVQEVRDEIDSLVMGGGETKCPICKRRAVKIIVRLDHGKMVFLYKLIKVWDAKGGGDCWVKSRGEIFEIKEEGLKASSGGVELRHWGLIEQGQKENGENHQGVYRPTQAGLDFLFGEVRMLTLFHRWRDRIVFWSKDTVSFKEAWDTEFDYEEAVSGIRREFLQ